ncbi:hypothetical protein ACQ27_gp317 [Klebsiella phage K64-1]|nr:hypothetical protein ACQ27_gp317 [Klebsiella phage K64-1]
MWSKHSYFVKLKKRTRQEGESNYRLFTDTHRTILVLI